MHAHAHSALVTKAEGLQTVGRALLVAYLEKDGNSQGKLADALGLVQSSVSLWASGKARPEPPIRTLLVLHAGIPVDAWLTDDERKHVESHRPKRTDRSTRRRTGTGG